MIMETEESCKGVAGMFLSEEDMPKKKVMCDVHGEFESKNFIGSIWSQCAKCAEDEDRAKKKKEAEKEKARAVMAWQKRLGYSGIPERFHDRTLSSFRVSNKGQEKAFRFAKEYVDGMRDVLKVGRCAVFVGNVGTGKTHLAVAIGLAFMQAKKVVMFTTVMRAVRKIKDSWRKDSGMTEDEAIQSLVYPDLLILDEVGIQFGSETEKMLLFDVLNERYERRKPTILMSNLILAEVKTYVGERIMDRFSEDGGEVVVFDWDSHRRKS